MDLFFQQLLEGISSGAIYAALALAIVLIFRGTGMLNLAQGEMAMLSTYFAWQLIQWGMPLIAVVPLTLVVSFLAGALIERVAIRPIKGADHLTVTIVTLGLFLAINSLAVWIWSSVVRDFPSMFSGPPLQVGDVYIGRDAVGTMVVIVCTFAALYWLFKRTSVGLAMRAATDNPQSSKLVGIPVGRMTMLSWGLASALGALAGILVVPSLFLEPNVLFGVLLYGFAAAALGGLDSFGGAIIGGLAVGILESLAGTYFVPADMKIILALALIVGVLVIRPSGLFGTRELVRA